MSFLTGLLDVRFRFLIDLLLCVLCRLQVGNEPLARYFLFVCPLMSECYHPMVARLVRTCLPSTEPVPPPYFRVYVAFVAVRHIGVKCDERGTHEALSIGVAHCDWRCGCGGSGC